MPYLRRAAQRNGSEFNIVVGAVDVTRGRPVKKKPPPTKSYQDVTLECTHVITFKSPWPKFNELVYCFRCAQGRIVVDLGTPHAL